MAGAKAGEARYQPQCGEWLIGGDGERLRRLLPSDFRYRVGELVEHRARSPLQDLARVGQQQRPMPPFEQGNAELLLERLNLPRQRRLGEEQLLRCACEGKVPRRGLESPDEIERRHSARRAVWDWHSNFACVT